MNASALGTGWGWQALDRPGSNLCLRGRQVGIERLGSVHRFEAACQPSMQSRAPSGHETVGGAISFQLRSNLTGLVLAIRTQFSIVRRNKTRGAINPVEGGAVLVRQVWVRTPPPAAPSPLWRVAPTRQPSRHAILQHPYWPR